MACSPISSPLRVRPHGKAIAVASQGQVRPGDASTVPSLHPSGGYGSKREFPGQCVKKEGVMVTGVKPTTTRPFNDIRKILRLPEGVPIQLAASQYTTLKPGEQIVIAL